eukprot:767559-Hanusia_phi.AAC.1
MACGSGAGGAWRVAVTCSARRGGPPGRRSPGTVTVLLGYRTTVTVVPTGRDDLSLGSVDIGGGGCSTVSH